MFWNPVVSSCRPPLRCRSRTSLKCSMGVLNKTFGVFLIPALLNCKNRLCAEALEFLLLKPIKAGQLGISLKDAGIVDPSLGLDADYMTSWDTFQFYLSNSIPASKGFGLFCSSPSIRLLASWDRDVDFSVCLCCSVKWGCHPDKTKTPLQCKYLQWKLIWSVRSYILLLLQPSPKPSPQPILSLPAVLLLPVRVLRVKILSYTQDFKIRLYNKKCNCIWQNLYSGHK